MTRYQTRYWLHLGLLAVIATLVTVSNSADNDDNNGWIYKGEKKQVVLYWRDVNSSPLPEFKAHTNIEAPLSAVLAALLDTGACAEWIHQCKEAWLVEQSAPNQQIIYQINKVPFAKDRDLIMRATLHVEEAGEIISIDITSATNFCDDLDTLACRRVNQANYVRVEHLNGRYLLRALANGVIEISWQQHLELGGNLPAWIVKRKLDDLAYKTLANLHTQVTKPQYQNLEILIADQVLTLVEAD